MAQEEALIQKQLGKMGSSAGKLSALEIATMGKNLHDAQTGNFTKLEMEADDDDWTPFIEEAKGNGPRSWFASKVDFKLHGAHFLGRLGYSVSAGVMPLFDGAAIDLKTSQMTSKKPKDAQPDEVQGSADGYSNWIEGEGGMLVLAPVGFDNVVPVRMEKVTVTEKGISGKAQKDIHFYNAGLSIWASGLTLADNEVRLEAPRMKSGDEAEVPVSGITIGSDGAELGEAIVDAPIDTTDTQEVSDAGESSGAEAVAQTSAEEGVAESEETQNEEGAAEDTAAQDIAAAAEALVGENGSGSEGNGEIQTNEAGTEVPAIATLELDEDGYVSVPKEVRTGGIVQALDDIVQDKMTNGIQTGDFAEPQVEEGPGAASIVLDVVKGLYNGGVAEEEESSTEKSISISPEGDIAIKIAGADEEQEQETLIDEVITAAKSKGYELGHDAVKDLFNMDGVWDNGVVDQFKQNGKAVGKDFTEAAQEVWDTGKAVYGEGKELVSQVKEEGALNTLKKAGAALADLASSSEEEVEGIVSQVTEESTAIQAVSKFLGMDDSDDNEEESTGKVNIPLASIPILPGVMFKVELVPELTLKPFVQADVNNLVGLLKSKGEEEEFNFTLSAGMEEASVSLALQAALSEGIPYLLEAKQALSAKVALSGTEGQKAFEGNVSVPLRKKKNGEIEQSGDITTNIGADIQLSAAIEFFADVGSKLFSWSKELYRKTIAEWKLARFRFDMGLSKAPKTGFLHGWSLDKAELQTEGLANRFADAFLTSNTEENRYGITSPDLGETLGYQNVQNDLKEAIELTEIIMGQIANPQENGMFIQSTDSGGDILSEISNLSSNFAVIWMKAQRENEYLLEQLEIAQKGQAYQNKQKAALESSRKHQERIEGVQRFDTDKGKVMNFYEGIGGGTGFKRHLEDRAEEEASTFEAITAYEKKRYLDKTKKFRKKYADVRAKAAELSGLDKDYAAKELFRFYTSDSKGKRITSHLDQFQSANKIRQFEMEERVKNSKEYRDKKLKFMAKQVEIDNKNKEREKKNKAPLDKNEIFKSFADSLDQNDILLFGCTRWLMDYERGRLEEYCKKNKVDLNHLNEVLEGTGNAGSLNKKDVNELKENKYMVATVDDIIEFELRNNKGEEGAALDEYLKGQPAGGAGLDAVFGAGKENKAKQEEAKKRIARHLQNQEKAKSARKYITIDILREHYNARLEKAKTSDEKKLLSKQLRFITEADLELEYISKKGTLEEVEQKQQEIVDEYFEKFSGVEQEYLNDLSEGNIVNIALMQEIFSETDANGEENLRLSRLREWKEQNISDHEILDLYLNEKGADKKKLSQFMAEKTGEAGTTLEQLKSFETQRLREKDKHIKGHYDRYSMIKNMSDEGKQYEEILEVYNARYKGGEGFAGIIKEKMKQGQFADGSELTEENILKFLSNQIARKEAVNDDHLRLIDEMEAAGKGYDEILQSYNQQVYSEWKESTSIVKYGKAKANELTGMEFKTDYEKSLEEELSRAKIDEWMDDKGLTGSGNSSKIGNILSVENIINFAKNEVEAEGAPHGERLRMLYGVAEIPDNLEELAPPTDEEEKEKRRLQYMDEAKRYKKSIKDAKKTIYEEMINDTFNGGDTQGSFLKDEIIKYESERKEHYDKILADYQKAENDARERQKKLEDEISLCSVLAYNMGDVANNPQAADFVAQKINKHKAAYMADGAPDLSSLEAAEARRSAEISQSLEAATEQLMSESFDEDTDTQTEEAV